MFFAFIFHVLKRNLFQNEESAPVYQTTSQFIIYQYESIFVYFCDRSFKLKLTWAIWIYCDKRIWYCRCYDVMYEYQRTFVKSISISKIYAIQICCFHLLQRIFINVILQWRQSHSLEWCCMLGITFACLSKFVVILSQIPCKYKCVLSSVCWMSKFIEV